MAVISNTSDEVLVFDREHRIGKEVSNRGPDRWLAIAIPRDTDGKLTKKVHLLGWIGRNREVDLQRSNRPRAAQISHGAFVARFDREIDLVGFLSPSRAPAGLAPAFAMILSSGVEGCIVFGGKRQLESRHHCAWRIFCVVEMVVTAPARIGDDLARFLERDRREIVVTVGGGLIDEIRPRERFGGMVEVGGEGKIDGGSCVAIKIDFHVAFICRGRPSAKDAARTLDIHRGRSRFPLANDAAASVSVGVPIVVTIGGRIVNAGAIIARSERRVFAFFWWNGEVVEIVKALDEIGIGQRVRIGRNDRRGGQNSDD